MLIAAGIAVFAGCSIAQSAGGSSMFETTFEDPDSLGMEILMQVTWWPGWILTVILIGSGIVGLLSGQSATASPTDRPAQPPTAVTPAESPKHKVWAPDPFQRHTHRLFDGSVWTDQVADDGLVSTDSASYPPPEGGSGWAPDPYGRYPSRYHDGRVWTDHVARSGQSTTDPAAHLPPASDA